MKSALLLLASAASSIAQEVTYTTVITLEGSVITTTMPYSDGWNTATVTASLVGDDGPFTTVVTLEGSVITTTMPYSDGWNTATVTASVSGNDGPYTTVVTLNGTAITTTMPYSDGWYTTTEKASFTGGPANATSSSATSTFTGAASPLHVGKLLQGGAAALGAAAYLL